MMEVSLRKITKTDFEDLWLHISSAKVAKYLTWQAYKDKEKGKEFLKRAINESSYPSEFLAIIFKTKLVGTIHIIERKSGKSQVGFSVRPEFKDLNIEATAVKKFIELLKTRTTTKWFSNGQMELIVDIHKKNIHAKRIIRDLGFILKEEDVQKNRDRYSYFLYDVVEKKKIIKTRIISNLKADEDIWGVFYTGSTAKSTENIFSDIDIWIIVYEESQWESVIKRYIEKVQTYDNVLEVYRSTYSHFFITYKSGAILDINIMTAPMYFGTQSTNKKMIFSRSSFDGFDIKLTRSLFVKAINSIERSTSKTLRGEYWVVPRFMNSFREDYILPLLNLGEKLTYINKVQVEFTNLETDLKDMLFDLFCRPERKSCKKAIISAIKITTECFEYFNKSQHGVFDDKKYLTFVTDSLYQINKLIKKL